MGYKGRDVEVTPVNNFQSIVMACDSSGAIGNKELDVIKVHPYLVGRLTARVALYEVISTGAEVKMLSAAISNELHPTGEGILLGIEDELNSIGLFELPIAISTEKNFNTKQTGLGVTVVGICNTDSLRICKSEPGDSVYCIGLPKVGNEIMGADDKEIIQPYLLSNLLKIHGIHDIIPIGSKGIMGEIQMLSKNINCSFLLENEDNLDLYKSAGPSTCAIITCVKDTKLKEINPTLLTYLGTLNNVSSL